MSDPAREQRAGESLLWAYDVTNQLTGGATLASVTSSSLTDLKTGASYPTGLSGAPSVSGATVRQRVVGLVVGKTYRLAWLWVDSAGNTQASAIVLSCPW